MNVVGLFSGIGGLELPFARRKAKTLMLCDVWEPSQAVLATRFPGVPIKGDIGELRALPTETQVVTAGFPCTDLSQAGRTAGIGGEESGLVKHVFRLLQKAEVEWLILENVRNMLVLDGGKAMQYLTSELERLGFKWAYRLVDSRMTGVPHRRHRVIFAASRHRDPRQVLFADETGDPEEKGLRQDAYGFYWTEGLRGLGWVRDGVPPLKGGSKIGIPSPPGIWLPNAPVGRAIVTPCIEDAEALQGFPRGWTAAAETTSKSPRWKLVGNAVSVGVSEWLVSRLYEPGPMVLESRKLKQVTRWPTAAFGQAGEVWEVQASRWPIRAQYKHLTDLLTPDGLSPLSVRATAGFLERTDRSSLAFVPEFKQALRDHLEFHSGASFVPAKSARVQAEPALA